MLDVQRTLQRIVDAVATADGDGVKIHRLAGRDLSAQFDPFLLLDEIYSDVAADYIGGFPAHPHRGFETITYMLHGAMRHRDHLGNEGLIQQGDMQWMTAGRGIIHSEMPEQREGLLHGFQLWLNLPASEKMKPAAYRDYRSDEFPVLDLGQGSSVKVIAGELLTATGLLQSPVARGSTQATVLDISLQSGVEFHQSVLRNHQLAVYVYQGSTTQLQHRQLGFYVDGDSVVIKAGATGVKALLLAAKPLKEPVKQYGPFVMNTSEELEQAIQDYNDGVLVA